MDYYDLVDVIGLCAEATISLSYYRRYIRTYLVILAARLAWVRRWFATTLMKKSSLNLACSYECLTSVGRSLFYGFGDA